RRSRPRFARVEPQNYEQEQALETRLVKLGWMPADEYTLRIGYSEGPGQIGRLAPKFTIDEVADAAGHEADPRQRCEKVENIGKMFAFHPGEHDGGHTDPGQAAMKGHPAVPDVENI